MVPTDHRLASDQKRGGNQAKASAEDDLVEGDGPDGLRFGQEQKSHGAKDHEPGTDHGRITEADAHIQASGKGRSGGPTDAHAAKDEPRADGSHGMHGLQEGR